MVSDWTWGGGYRVNTLFVVSDYCMLFDWKHSVHCKLIG